MVVAVLSTMAGLILQLSLVADFVSYGGQQRAFILRDLARPQLYSAVRDALASGESKVATVEDPSAEPAATEATEQETRKELVEALQKFRSTRQEAVKEYRDQAGQGCVALTTPSDPREEHRKLLELPESERVELESAWQELENAESALQEALKSEDDTKLQEEARKRAQEAEAERKRKMEEAIKELEDALMREDTLGRGKDESAELIDVLQAAIDKGTVAGIEGDLIERAKDRISEIQVTIDAAADDEKRRKEEERKKHFGFSIYLSRKLAEEAERRRRAAEEERKRKEEEERRKRQALHVCLHPLDGDLRQVKDKNFEDTTWTPEEINDGTMWAQLKGLNKDGHLLGLEAQVLEKGHAYSLLRVEEIDGHRLVQLRNPWGVAGRTIGCGGSAVPRDRTCSMEYQVQNAPGTGLIMRHPMLQLHPASIDSGQKRDRMDDRGRPTEMDEECLKLRHLSSLSFENDQAREQAQVSSECGFVCSFNHLLPVLPWECGESKGPN
eukprot:Skav210410  [mRNA]  locus=scaffold1416:351549:380375:- [translate_table: standard]